MLAYLASFFLFPGFQKSFFYLLVALPSIALTVDLRQLFREEHRIPVAFVMIFSAYFALSSLWSNDGQLASGLKLALSVVLLLVAVHSTMSMRIDSGVHVRNFILIVGSFAVCFYFVMFVAKMLDTAEYSTMLSGRVSSGMLSALGDANPINTAIYFGLVTLTAWWDFPRHRSLTKFGLLFVIAASVAMMLLTKSRGPILSLTIVLVLISAFRRNKDDLILWGIVLIAGVVGVTYFNVAPTILDRAASPNYRLGIWLNAIKLIKNNLIFGQGLGDSANIPISIVGGGIVTVSHSHSSILEPFRVGGLVGGFIFVAMILTIAFQPLRANRERLFFISWLAYGLLCLSSNGRLPFMRPSVEWFAFWIPLFFVLFNPAETRNATRRSYIQP